MLTKMPDRINISQIEHTSNKVHVIDTRIYDNKKAVLSQGNRAIPQLFFSV